MRELLRPGIEGRTFRANPSYELTPLQHAPGPDIEAHAWLRSRAWPPDRPVDRLVAEVFTDLAKPGPVPLRLRAHPHGRAVAAALVLDEVLQIESGGSFVCGPEACPAVCREMPDPHPGSDLDRLSLDAVHWGERLAIEDPPRLAARLYFYNRAPLTPHWARTFAGAEAVASYLHLRTDAALATLLEDRWVSTTVDPTNEGWFTWRSRTAASDARQRTPSWKLYVSPVADHLRDAFRPVVEAITDCGVLAFKVGSDGYQLLRPDKFMAYFSTFAHLTEAAARILRVLADCPAQGVPFTGDLGGDGLLSWGTDAMPEPALPWENRGSWRTWVAGHLASALIAARYRGTMEPWRFALVRLAVAGVDTDAWTPKGNPGESLS